MPSAQLLWWRGEGCSCPRAGGVLQGLSEADAVPHHVRGLRIPHRQGPAPGPLQPSCLGPGPHAGRPPPPCSSPPPRSSGAWVPREGLPHDPSAPQSPAPLGCAGSNYPGSICRPHTAGGVSQKLRAAQACRIPAYLPQAHHPSAGGLWAAAARWGAWIQPAVPWGSLPPTL